MAGPPSISSPLFPPTADLTSMHEHALRTFLGWEHPALAAVATLLADEYARPDEIVLGDVVVVLPGARAGRRLKELLLAESERRELPLVPPRLVTASELPGLLVELDRPIADPVLTRRLWSLALRDTRAALLPVHPVLPDPEDLTGWEVLADQIQRLHRELCGGGHRFADVARVCRSGELLHDDSERWETLARVQESYEALLEEVGRADADLARLDASEEATKGFNRTVWLVGVVEMPESLRRLLLRLNHPPRVVIHAPASESDGFDELGCIVAAAWSERELDVSDAHLVIADRPGDQAAAAAAELALLADGYAVEDVTIAVPDPDLVPFIEQRLAAEDIDTRFGAGTQITATGPYRLLEAIADYLEGRAWDAFAALARHPDLPAGDPAPLHLLDEYHGRHLPLRIDRAPAADGSRAAAFERTRRALEGPRLLGLLTGTEPLSGWAIRIVGVLLECYGRSTLNRDDPGNRRLLSALETLRSAAADFHHLPELADERCEAATAIRLMLEAVKAGVVADEPDRSAIELVGWLEMRLDDAPVAIVTGLNEPHLPQSVNVDAFLPDALRARLGLVDNVRRYARDAYELTAVIHSRAVVRLVVGRLDADGNPLRPSRLMLACRGAPLAHRVRRFANATPGSGAIAPVLRAGRSEPGYPLPPEPVLTLPAPERIRVTDLSLLLTDPYGFALQRALDLGSCDDEAREMDGLVFGSLAHRVLQRFGHLPEARSTDSAAIFARLGALLDDEQARRFGAGALPAVAIQVEQLRRRLRAFAGWQAAHTAAGWETVLVEGVPTGSDGSEVVPSFGFAVDGEPITISGRIDRIDRNRESGGWLVLDYKTGDSARTPEETHRKGRTGQREWVDLQLPMYLHMARAISDGAGAPLIPAAEHDRIRAGYIVLPRDLEKVALHLAEWSGPELAGADEAATRAVRTLREGEFAFDSRIAARQRDGEFAALLGLRVTSAVPAEDVEVDA